MNEFSFENQGVNTYLVYQIGTEDTVDSMSLGMITNNQISGLAAAMFTQMDTTKYIKYNVSSRVSVRQFFSGIVNKKRLLGVFSGIVNALLSSEDYMIDERNIILDLDYIFVNVSSCDTVLVCLPVEQMAEAHDLKGFFKQVMFETQFDQSENCDYVAHIINYLNSASMFSLVDFRNLIEKEKAIGPGMPTAARTVPKQTIPSQPHSKTQTPPSVQFAFTAAEQKRETPPYVARQKFPAQTPPAAESSASDAVVAPQPIAPEKKISMFGLLMHYSKENAELYKKQKASKKAGQAGTPVQTPAPAIPSKQQVPPSFAIPGNAGPQEFMIPGQATSAAQTVTKKENVQSTQRPQPSPVPAAQPPKPSVEQQTILPNAQQPVQKPVEQPRSIPQGQGMNFGGTTVLSGGMVGGTTVLSEAGNAARPVVPYLIRKKNGEKIMLNKPVFRIGRERSYVDYFIGDNTNVSHSHASFVTRDGAYAVVDTNSTNGTFVNGTRLQSNVETQLDHGDTVRIANEEFEFKLY